MSLLAWKLGAFAVVLVVLITTVVSVKHTYDKALLDTRTAQDNLKMSQSNNETLGKALDQQKMEVLSAQQREQQINKLLQEKTDEAAKAEQSITQFRSALEVLRKNKPVDRAWTDTPVPDDIRLLLRNDAASGSPDSSHPVSKSGSSTVDDVAHPVR